MDAQATLPGFSPNTEYPPPPRVHWFVLLLAWIALAFLFLFLAPEPYQKLLQSLAVDAWAFYLCLWIRSLDPHARSPFWCDAYVVVELAYALMSIRQNPSEVGQDIVNALAFASFALGIWTIYLIRADLLKHYNQREPIGLELNGAMTRFFSFLYFQSKLYPIAQSKKRQAEQAQISPWS
jgi:hypothetical protein